MPWEFKLFVVYLLSAVGVSAVRSVSLARQLWWSSKERRILPTGLGSNDPGADVLTTSALTNRLSNHPAFPVSSQSGVLPDNSHNLSSSRVLEEANRRFLYAWEMCAARIASMKRLALLTLLLSVLVFSHSAVKLLAETSSRKMAGIAFVAGNMAEGLAMFALGILVCIVIYAVCVAYEGALMRRRAAWNYYYARDKSQSADG